MLLQDDTSDLSGTRFGRLVVLSSYDPTTPIGFHNNRWRCLCDCADGDQSQQFVVYRCRLTSGQTQSCGCLSRQRLREGRTKHGFSPALNPHHLYSTWEGMLSRCENPNCRAYKNYGGRGITVCEEWHSFPAFLADMEATWSPGKTLDRKDTDRGYFKDNCKWSTRLEQANNRRDNVRVTVNGETKTTSEFCRQYKITHNTVASRLDRGWSPDAAFTEPVVEQKRTEVGDITFQGKTQSGSKWAKEVGIRDAVIYLRLKAGWSVEKTLTTPTRIKRPNGYASGKLPG